MSERKCKCCGKSYDYCPNCGKSSSKPWMFSFDTEVCKELFNAVSAYNMELIKEDGIRNIVNKYNITDFSVYKDDIKDLLTKISRIKEPEKSIVIEEKVEEKKTPVFENEFTGETPRRGRRNRFFE